MDGTQRDDSADEYDCTADDEKWKETNDYDGDDNSVELSVVLYEFPIGSLE